MANKISGVICSIDDITEKVKQHKELERVKAYFETIFKDSPISLFIIDKFGIILDHNKAANMITGCPANYSQVGVNILESHQSQSGEIFSFIKKVLKDEDEFFEFNNVTIDEKVVNFKVTRLVIGKESIGYIIAVEDITDKVCQNQELELALSKIKQQEEKYRQLVESMNSGLITTDSEECLTFVNKSFCEMTGYSQHELIGQKKTDYIDFGMEKDELDKAIQMIKNHEFTEDLVGEITVTKKNGELIYAQCSSTIREDEKGNFIGFADVITDITQRKKTEEALIIAKQKAEVANKTKSEFLSNMSHEIRTPMNAILGFTEILYGIIKDKTQREYISSIASSGKTLLTLINDILDLSKVEAGKLELNCSLVNPYSIFEDMSLIFSHKIAEKGLSYIIDIDPKLPTALLLDETRVRQVLLNLISNAVKFTENGFIKLTVSYEPCEDDEKKLSLLFSVEDTGIGIPQEEIELIFKAFKQSKPRNQSLQSGTGLGLTITKRLIKLMGGEIAVTSELNKGSRFHVIIKNITISDDNPDSLSNELTLPENLIFDPATLLIVDDIKLNRDLVKAYLDPYPFNVIEGENGAQAIKLAESHKPDMIFMDLKMPDMNGFEATKRIKNISGLESTPVIAFTASAMKEIEDEIYQTCDGYLKKPVNKILLLREIAKHISFQCGVSQTQDSAGHCGAEAENLDEKVLSELPDLLSQLEGELKSKWERISDKLVFDDIEGFGDEVKELALQYQYSDLKYWADELKSQVETFDV
ncbi:MAG: PAS domain S-box protein, partial [Spirochaetota bacterium]|nr:PAS domain S-box protein [Spirochaetota bacterium]